MQAYCIKCQVMREIKNPTRITIPSGSATKGTCPVCGTVVCLADKSLVNLPTNP